ncbi:MAG TPA: tetratricopeptide repeat protein [Candidatus Saccharimonadales bacterium]|nr:tetratricopeptide repeat protein [Candidatus Saccharimonadales bacterium]
MNRLLLLSLLALSATVPVSAQDQPAIQDNDSPKVERIAAPSPTASVRELEDTGDLLRARKDYLDAIDYYRAGLLKADSATLHNKIGICLIQLQRYGDSKKEFERAVKLDAKYPEAHNNLGAADYQLRRFGAAVREYTRAIKLNDESAHFHSNLGSAYFSRKEFDKATREYQRALQLDPSIFDPQAGGGVSVKLATQGDRAYFHYMIAKMYGVKGDEEHCRLYLAKANEAGYPYVKDALKDGEFSQLRKDPGFVAFIRSLKRHPDSVE